MQVSYHGSTGVIPKAFVEIIEDLPIDVPMEGWDALLPKIEGYFSFY